jgi:serine/threonine-protein kinase
MAHLFGEVAIGMELATPKQIEDALSRQQALRQGHAKSRLGEVLIMMNVLSVEQVKKILSEQRKRREDEQKDVGMQHFGEYKILEKLGEGGLGAVYKAVATLTGKVVAIKILLKRFSGNTTYGERFSREATLATSLQHPNIVTCLSSGVLQGMQYLIMEFIEGETLKVRMERCGGKLAERDALSITSEVAKGLACAHAAGIVHRDIKPENILLGKDGSVKITDFGTAKSFLEDESLSRTGIVLGTPHYMAPEQIRGEKQIDHRADMYALGAMLYYLLTGRVPFDAPSKMEIMRKHLSESLENPMDINPDVSKGAAQIVNKLMAKTPEARYQRATEVVEDIGRVLAGQEPTLSSLEMSMSMIRPRANKTQVAKRKKGGFFSTLLHRLIG